MTLLSRSKFALTVSLLSVVNFSDAAVKNLRKPLEGSSENKLKLLSLSLSKFHLWMDKHGKEYNSREEKLKNLETWMGNDHKIYEHNSKESTYTLGHNEYSDMNQDEFAQHFKLGKYASVPPTYSGSVSGGGGVSMIVEEGNEYVNNEGEKVALPDYVDWVSMGGVSEMKNQGYCGACWAFSTTGAIEGAKFIKTGELVSLSEQNLLDCDHTDLACNGGIMDDAFKFDEKSGGLCSEEDYPYKAKKNKICNLTNCTDVPGTIVKTFVDVPPASEKALLSAIALQPISVAIEGSTFSFQFYKGGVLTDTKCGKNGELDHGVLAVGYGTDLETQEPYFLVKNSWGTSWGLGGYVKIGRDSSVSKYGICSIMKMASFPEVE